jgi:cell division septation protein DedD
VRLTPLILLAALAACSGKAPIRAPAGAGAHGPDAILVRMPKDGGVAHAYRWGKDSSLWSSSARSPALDRVLAFDAEDGALAYVDAKGVPGRLDLRVGNAGAAATTALVSLASADGWAIYGLTPKREVSRLTPSGTWTFAPDREPRELIPLTDGSLVMLSDDGERSRLNRLRPPEPRVTDTASVPHADFIVRTDLGDRLYFAGDSGLAGLRVRDFARTKTIALKAPVADVAPTPSGDRLFVALKGKKNVTVVDRYSESVDRTIDLPDAPTALRMDPDGQYLLARSANGDSVRIIALGTSRLIGTVRSAWRADLPLVAPDGGLALAQDNDVVIVDSETRRERNRYLAGAADLWTLIRWNGFRPRAAGLDQPVRFADEAADAATTQRIVDSSLVAHVGAVADASPTVFAATPAPKPNAPPPAAPPTASPAASPAAVGALATSPAKLGKAAWTLSFAALLNEQRAKAMALSIRVDGKPVRVVPGTRDGTAIYRIVYGPFDTRDDAEKAGKRTGLPYWVYEGAP